MFNIWFVCIRSFGSWNLAVTGWWIGFNVRIGHNFFFSHDVTYIEDLAWVIILCEIYETRLRWVSWISYEMATCKILFNIWPFGMGFKMNSFNKETHFYTVVVNDVTCTCMSKSVITPVAKRFLWHDVIHWITTSLSIWLTINSGFWIYLKYCISYINKISYELNLISNILFKIL